MTTRTALGVWTLTLLAATGAIATVLTSDHATDKATTIAFAVPTGIAFVISGLIARSRQPGNRTGALLVTVGLAWFLGALASADEPILFTAGLLLGSGVFTAILAHLLLAFPTGRLEERADRLLIGAAYFLVIAGPLLVLMFDAEPNVTCEGPCPENVAAITHAPGLAGAFNLGYVAVAVLLMALLIVRLVQRWRGATPALRRALSPVFLTGLGFVVAVLIVTALSTASEELAERLNWIALAALLTVPLSFLYGLLRPRFGAATRRLVAELSEKRRPSEVQAVLRRVLRDPELRLGMPHEGGYVDVDGVPLELPADGTVRAVTAMGDELIVHDAALRHQPELEEVLAAAQIALERGITLRSLETSERRGTAMLDAIPDNVFRVRSDGTFVDAHVRRNVGIFGGAEAFVGRTVSEVMPPHVAPKLLAALEEVLSTGEPARVEYELAHEGSAVHIEARVARSGDDEVVAITRDVTDLKESEAALRGLAEGRAALSRVAVAVATAATPDDVFTVVTEEVGRLFRADAANLIRFDRLKENEGLIVGRWSSLDSVISAVGTRIELLGGAVTQVRQTGRPARGRVGDRARTEPELHARLTELGITSYVAAPIEVSGELWGAVVVWLRSDDDFPEDAEERLVQFGRLVSVALANAQAREELATLAEEQAALSRVAVAVATEERPELLFDHVSEEVGKLLGASSAATVRYLHGEDATVIVGGWNREGEFDRRGVRVPFQGGAIARVHDSNLPERVDVDGMTSAIQERMIAEGVSSQVAAPIVVSGRLWGATSVSTGPSERFASDAEGRLGKFTNLVAVALANAEAREQLSGLAEEQAALRRVAVAVATEQEPDQLFNTVSREIGLLFGAQTAETVRFIEDTDEAEIVGGWNREGSGELEVGRRLPFQGGAIRRVAQTGRPGRIDLENEPPEIQEFMRAAGVSWGVAAPIVVSGRLWGATSILILSSDQLPHDAEARLEQFTNLVAVALANAEARESLAALALEQAALTRVAVAVATEETPERVFDVVTEEVARLMGAHAGSTVRYLDDAEEVMVVGNWQIVDDYELQKGERFQLRGGAITQVKRTGQPARTDYQLRNGDWRQMVAAPIVVSGHLWGAATISIPAPLTFAPDVEERLGSFTRLVAVAIANAEAREQLTASRARIVEAGDAERRRLERNLHDGAQQRLVSLALALRLAQARLPDDPSGAKDLLERASEELAVGLEELRELARGIHPAILTDRGLAPALESLAARAPVPVEVAGLPRERLPGPIEAAAFYVVAESLTNVAKYAWANQARVEIARNDGLLVVQVTDDGIGGADVTRGSGLRGLADRVEALGGRLHVASENGRGTTVRAELPV